MGHGLPNSFLSSYRIHENLVSEHVTLDEKIINSLSRYLWCILVVQFDIDIGPDLKLIRPSISPHGEVFSEDDFRTICFSALPERSAGGQLTGSFSDFHMMSFHPSSSPDLTLHGYMQFVQRRDPTKARGYTQESVVIITEHRYPSLFYDVLNTIVDCSDFAALSLDQKIPVLDSAINNISSWPDLLPDQTMDLPLLGRVLTYVVPQSITTPLVEPGFLTSPIERWSSFIPTCRFSNHRKTHCDDLYVIYELLVLNRPLHGIIVYANAPHTVSLFIDSCLDLIRPFPYPLDHAYEYVTIHSDAWATVDPKMGAIYGVTNPLVLRGLLQSPECTTWYTIALDDATDDLDVKTRSLIKNMNRKVQKGCLLSPDAKFLASLGQMNQGIITNSQGVAKQDDIHHYIRFHFATLTSKLIAPLTGYFRSFGNATVLHFDHPQFYTDLLEASKPRSQHSSHSRARTNQFVLHSNPELFVAAPNLFASAYSNYFRFGGRSSQKTSDGGFGGESAPSVVKFYKQLANSACFTNWLTESNVIP